MIFLILCIKNDIEGFRTLTCFLKRFEPFCKTIDFFVYIVVSSLILVEIGWASKTDKTSIKHGFMIIFFEILAVAR